MGRGATRLQLSLSYADGCRAERRLTLAGPCQLDLELMNAADDLLQRTWQRRVRLRFLRLRCERLAAPDRQLELFATTRQKGPATILQHTLDRLRERFGAASVQWGRNRAVIDEA